MCYKDATMCLLLMNQFWLKASQSTFWYIQSSDKSHPTSIARMPHPQHQRAAPFRGRRVQRPCRLDRRRCTAQQTMRFGRKQEVTARPSGTVIRQNKMKTTTWLHYTLACLPKQQIAVIRVSNSQKNLQKQWRGLTASWPSALHRTTSPPC